MNCYVVYRLVENGCPSFLFLFQFDPNLDLLDNFYSFLAFTIVDCRYKSVYKTINYADKSHRELCLECFKPLNKTASLIMRFSLKFNTSHDDGPEIIKSFFEGKFFKKHAKDVLKKVESPIDKSKTLLMNISESLFLSFGSPELFLKTRKLCEYLFEIIDNIILYEEVEQYQSMKQSFSIGGSKGRKLNISNEQQEDYINRFKEKYPGILEQYNIPEKRRSVVRTFNEFIRKDLAKKNNFDRLNVSSDTTRKQARKILDDYFSKLQNKSNI